LKSIALIGLPGSGKTTIGKLLARQLGLPFVDLDHEIEADIGSTIRDFFEAHGEAAFRDVEARVLRRLVQQPPSILSTGGGIVLRAENRECLRDACRVVYLRASAEDLFRRLRHDRKRPLLQVADPLQKLRELQAERGPLYAEVAHLSVEAGTARAQAVVKAIVAQLDPAA